MVCRSCWTAIAASPMSPAPSDRAAMTVSASVRAGLSPVRLVSLAARRSTAMASVTDSRGSRLMRRRTCAGQFCLQKVRLWARLAGGCSG
jgi:hypothetical protein